LDANRALRADVASLRGSRQENIMPFVAFAVFVIVGQVLNVMLCLAIDRMVSPTAGALAFVGLYMLVFVVAWKLALLIFDREPRDARRTDRIPAH
jgi:hypothetical protein